MSKDEWAFLEGKEVDEVEVERRAAKLVPILPGILLSVDQNVSAQNLSLLIQGDFSTGTPLKS